MKIAITGHTSGIGKSLFDYYESVRRLRDDTALGFSRSNGYNINNPQKIIEQSLDSDVFINNAYAEFAQVELLYGLWKHWKFLNRQIICISSVSPDVTKGFEWPYSIHKGALDKACAQLHNIPKSNCRVINILSSCHNCPAAQLKWPTLAICPRSGPHMTCSTP